MFVFQDDRLESLLHYTGVGAIDISVPILLFAVIFGLSTDYGVFLLSRIVEARNGGESSSSAIALGLERTGTIITAAALLFAVAMGSFAFSQMIFIKEVAVGTAVAVLVDATFVRGFLMPSMMHLCGALGLVGAQSTPAATGAQPKLGLEQRALARRGPAAGHRPRASRTGFQRAFSARSGQTSPRWPPGRHDRSSSPHTRHQPRGSKPRAGSRTAVKPFGYPVPSGRSWWARIQPRTSSSSPLARILAPSSGWRRI